MTNAASAGVRLKLNRARKHLAELEEGAREYLASGPFEVYTVAKPGRGPISYRVHVRSHPPEELGVIVGDALHNARSALDHVACRLVEHGGGLVVQATGFPAARSAKGFAVAVKAKLEGASDEVKVAVEALAVHPGGDESLWSLHQLDIDDKHKVLLPVGMYSGGFNLHKSFRDLVMPPINIRTQEVLPITEAVEIFSISEEARFSEPHGDFRQDYSFPFELALRGVSWSPDRPVPAVEATTIMIDRAESAATELMELME